MRRRPYLYFTAIESSLGNSIKPWPLALLVLYIYIIVRRVLRSALHAAGITWLTMHAVHANGYATTRRNGKARKLTGLRVLHYCAVWRERWGEAPL